jgi:hypothetical protein
LISSNVSLARVPSSAVEACIARYSREFSCIGPATNACVSKLSEGVLAAELVAIVFCLDNTYTCMALWYSAIRKHVVSVVASLPCTTSSVLSRLLLSHRIGHPRLVCALRPKSFWALDDLHEAENAYEHRSVFFNELVVMPEFTHTQSHTRHILVTPRTTTNQRFTHSTLRTASPVMDSMLPS